MGLPQKPTSASDDYYFEEVLLREVNDKEDYGIAPDFRSDEESYLSFLDPIDEIEEVEEDFDE